MGFDRVRWLAKSWWQHKPKYENGKFLARTMLGDPSEYAELLSAQNTKVFGSNTSNAASPGVPGRARFAATTVPSPDAVKSPQGKAPTGASSSGKVHAGSDQLFEGAGLDREDELKLALSILGDTRRKERDDRYPAPGRPTILESTSWGANPSILEQKRARTQQIGDPNKLIHI